MKQQSKGFARKIWWYQSSPSYQASWWMDDVHGTEKGKNLKVTDPRKLCWLTTFTVCKTGHTWICLVVGWVTLIRGAFYIQNSNGLKKKDWENKINNKLIMEISEIIQGTGNNLKTKCIIDCQRFLKRYCYWFNLIIYENWEKECILKN